MTGRWHSAGTPSGPVCGRVIVLHAATQRSGHWSRDCMTAGRGGSRIDHHAEMTSGSVGHGPGSPHPDDGTWHHGLIARYWYEFNRPEPAELAWYRKAIERFGQPALDLACGAGRLLAPLAAEGIDVDGVDVSADMILWAARAADDAGVTIALHRQAAHELHLDRRYRTIYCCDSFGIGGGRARDLEALRRVRAHLEPGGAFVFSNHLLYSEDDPERFARWLPGHHLETVRE